MPIMNTVIKGGGSSAPAHYIEFPVDANGELIQPTTVSTLGNIKVIHDYGLAGLLYQNRSVISLDLDSIEIIKDYGVYYCASSGAVLTSASFKSVVYVGIQAFGSFARTNSYFTTILLPSLKIVALSAFENAFRSSGVSTISFPALNSANALAFNTMLNGISNCILHFPSNTQSIIETLTGYPNFGGTNTTVLFDLPATVILTGANSQAYERSPKDDTATALAWRKQDTGTAPNLVIDWTPFYTSGTTDPAVSDTIYSDSACTVAVTTISSIA